MQDLDIICFMVKFFLQLLLPELKEHCAVVANDLIQTTTNEPNFLKKFITGVESWVHNYDPEMKAQSFQWKSSGSPHPKTARHSHQKTKIMVTVFFD